MEMRTMAWRVSFDHMTEPRQGSSPTVVLMVVRDTIYDARYDGNCLDSKRMDAKL